MEVYKCFHCGRMYLNKNGHLRLWPYREYEHLSFLRANRS
jgi:DNA-directed RNA polymerase subunit RPC12/RpoP